MALEPTLKYFFENGLFIPCQLEATNVYRSGQYAMLNITMSSCLQNLSNTIVTKTYVLAQQNQPVPEWVKNLPEPDRDKAIEYVKMYGSPSVFDEFVPHITIGWANDTDALNDAVTQLSNALIDRGPSMFNSLSLAIGSVGPHGTVYRGKDIAEFTW
jgi:hypothetical protein